MELVTRTVPVILTSVQEEASAWEEGRGDRFDGKSHVLSTTYILVIESSAVCSFMVLNVGLCMCKCENLDLHSYACFRTKNVGRNGKFTD